MYFKQWKYISVLHEYLIVRVSVRPAAGDEGISFFGKFKRQNVQVKKFVLFTEANNIFYLNETVSWNCLNSP